MKEPLKIDTTPLKEHEDYRPVFFDFEVFRHHTMLTLYDVYLDKWYYAETPERCGEMLKAMLLDPRIVFAGFNSTNYDNLIATGCMEGFTQQDIWDLNCGITGKMPPTIHGEKYSDFSDLRFRLPGVWRFARRSWDVGRDLPPAPKIGPQGVKIPVMSLKAWEKYNGYPVRRSPVPFSISRVLTKEELEKVAEYNRYDVAATCAMAVEHKGKWFTRCGFASVLGAKKFGWYMTFPRLAAKLFVTNPEKKVSEDDITWRDTVPSFPACLDLGKYWDVKDHFTRPLHEIEKSNFVRDVAGVPHALSIGGIHTTSGRYVYKGEIFNIDVGSMYPAIMCFFDLTARSMDADKYKEVLQQRLSMPKSDWRRDVFKQALNSTYGAMLDPPSEFYDPAKARQVCILGQCFIIDLIDKLEPHISLIQSNTDGLYVIPNSNEDGVHIRSIIDDFTKRTNLTLEIEIYTAIYQRDVNNYIVVDINGKEKTKGGAFMSTNHKWPSVIQRANRCEIMGIKFDPLSIPLEQLSITCTRDKNSDGFYIDGKVIPDEFIDVVPVYPFSAQDIRCHNPDGSTRKARFSPDYCALASSVDVTKIDFFYFTRKRSTKKSTI